VGVVVVVVVVRKEASEVRNACRQGSMAWIASKGGDERSQLPSWAGACRSPGCAAPPCLGRRRSALSSCRHPKPLSFLATFFFFWLSNSFPAQEEERGDLFGNAAAGSMRSELRRQWTNAPMVDSLLLPAVKIPQPAAAHPPPTLTLATRSPCCQSRVLLKTAQDCTRLTAMPTTSEALTRAEVRRLHRGSALLASTLYTHFTQPADSLSTVLFSWTPS
jgi:hypothetical protein